MQKEHKVWTEYKQIGIEHHYDVFALDEKEYKAVLALIGNMPSHLPCDIGMEKEDYDLLIAMYTTAEDRYKENARQAWRNVHNTPYHIEY